MRRSDKILYIFIFTLIFLIGLCGFFWSKPKPALANPGTCYWVGTANPSNWNNAANWSSTSGGGGNTCEGGVNIPQAGTAVIFNAAKNNSVNVDIDVSVASITAAASGYSGTFDATTHNITLSGNLAFGSGTLSMGSGTWTVSGNFDLRSSILIAGTSTLILNGGAAAQTLTPNMQRLNNLTIKTTHASGTIINDNHTIALYLAGNLLVDGNLYLSADGASNVLLDAATHNCSVTVNGNLDFTGTGAGSESILMGSGTWAVNGNVDFTGGTITSGTSTLDLSGSTEQSLTLAGQTLNNLRVTNSSGSNVNFVDNITATNFAAAVSNSKLVFGAGKTYNFTNIDLNGQAAGTKVVLASSTPGTKWLLNISGAQIVANVNVSDSNALGGNQISAVNSVDSGNNVNWTFIESNSSLSPSENTWQFSSAEDFTVSDDSKVKFSNNSVKIIPTGFEKAWGKIWHDTHFAPNPGDSGVDSIVTDSSGYLYIGGYTNDGAGGSNVGFIVKADQDLNESWYKNDYFPGALVSEIYRMKFTSDGNILVHGGYQDSSNNCHSVLMKINPNDGSVIWSTTIDQPVGVVRLSGWDRAAGPVVDSNGNIYIATADHLGAGQNDAEPTGIYKFDSNGNLIWSRSDSLGTHKLNYVWEDLWDMVVDSEGSVYLSLSCLSSIWPSSLYWNVVKYDTDGNYQWINIKQWPSVDQFQAPRGIAIDSNDYTYQNGNAGGFSPLLGAGCGFRKLDKDGNVLFEDVMNDIAGGDIHCWGSVIDQFDNWATAGQINVAGTASSYIKKYRGADVTKINVISNDFLPRFSYSARANHITIDQWGNTYSATYFIDNDYSAKYSIAILKGVNTYPNTIPGTGTILTLVNKTPVSYNILNNFSVEYGPMDQADVKFQISNDGIKWYYFDGSSWVETAGYDSNTEAEVNINISKFSDQFGPGQFYFKSFMITDGTKEVDLKSVTVTKDLPLSILPKTGKTQ